MTATIHQMADRITERELEARARRTVYRRAEAAAEQAARIFDRAPTDTNAARWAAHIEKLAHMRTDWRIR